MMEGIKDRTLRLAAGLLQQKVSRAPKPPRPYNHVEHNLIGIAASILQTSGLRARVALSTGVKVAAGSAAAGGLTGLVAIFGTASTGTAIASLYGAAQSTATLYWIGGLVGGGVAAGGLIVAAGGMGAGIYASRPMVRWMLGKPRRGDELTDSEKRILSSVAILRSAITDLAERDRPVSDTEAALFSRIGIRPLVAEVERVLAEGGLDGLKMSRRIRLRGHVAGLVSLARRLEHER